MSQDDKVYLTANQVRARYGGISDMTLRRWTGGTVSGFPAPLRIAGRKYWDTAALDAFDASRAAAVTPKAVPPHARKRAHRSIPKPKLLKPRLDAPGIW